MKHVSQAVFEAHFEDYIDRAEAGEEIVITVQGKPVMKLIPYRDTSPRDLSSGIWKGQVWMADDFDELPEEMQRAFGMIDDET